MSTISAILVDCIQQSLGLPRTPIQTDIRDEALAIINEYAQAVWLSWPFDNEKLDEFTVTPVAGIITFPTTTESVRAIRGVDSAGVGGERVFNEDELIAAARGEQIASERFQHLSDDPATGARRIRVSTDATVTAATYQALCLARFVEATVEAAYSVLNPAATPTDYRVLRFLLDRAEPALRAYVKNQLRANHGLPPVKIESKSSGDHLLNVAVQRENYDNDRERRVNPRSLMFTDLGDMVD